MRFPVILLIFVCFAIYLGKIRPIAESDCVPAPYTAWSLVRHGSFDLRYYPQLERYLGSCVVKVQDGAWVTKYPPGSSLVAVPFVAPLALIHQQPPSENCMIFLGKLTAAACVAIAAGLFFLVCRRIAQTASWPATILFAFGTCLYSVASQALWIHGPATLWLCCALYLLIGDEVSATDAAMAGFTLGLAVLTRPTTAFFAMATWLVFLIQGRWRRLSCLTLGGVFPLVFLCLFNWFQYHSPIKGGYIHDVWNVHPPLLLGLSGLLVAPSRGVFIYSPALLFLPLGIRQLILPEPGSRNESMALLRAWLTAAAVTLVFYARWWDWSGEWCYGPRLLCETMPVLCLTFALGYEHLQSPWSRGVAWGLVALSVTVHFLGVFGNKGSVEWHRRHELPDQSLSMFEFHDTQIAQHLRSLIEEFTRKK